MQCVSTNSTGLREPEDCVFLAAINNMRDVISASRSIIKSSRSLTGRTGGSFTAVTVLGVALLVSIAGSYVTYKELSGAFTHHNLIDITTQRMTTLYRLQVDEETGLRGFLASGQRGYLDPYLEAEQKIGPAFDDLTQFNQTEGLAQE